MQIEALSIALNCSDAVYTLLGELWLKKKRTLAIKQLKLAFASHVSNHDEFQTFMTSINQNARLQALDLHIVTEYDGNCQSCT